MSFLWNFFLFGISTTNKRAALAPLGIMGTELKTPWNSSNITAILYRRVQGTSFPRDTEACRVADKKNSIKKKIQSKKKKNNWTECNSISLRNCELLISEF